MRSFTFVICFLGSLSAVVHGQRPPRVRQRAVDGGARAHRGVGPGHRHDPQLAVELALGRQLDRRRQSRAAGGLGEHALAAAPEDSVPEIAS